MKSKFVKVLLALVAVLCLCLGLAACDLTGQSKEPEDEVWTIERVYATAKELGFEGTLEDLIAEFKGEAGRDGKDGQNGQDGKDGVGIKRIYINENGELVIELTEGDDINLGLVHGKDGADGQDGKDGADGQDGKDGVTPHIGENGHWFIGEQDTGVKAEGQDGQDGQNGQDGTDGTDGVTPHIGENGHWFIGEQDTGVKAEGQDGQDGQNGQDGTDGTDGVTPHIGENGHWFIGEQDTGVKAEGQDGQDGQNGQDGTDGTDGVTPHIGENGHWFIGEQDTGVKAEGQDGQDGQNGQDGTDGTDGVTPHIGENGHWFIGEQDTGVKAQGTDGQDLTKCEHIFPNDWEVRAAATCTSIGYSTRTCEACGFVDYQFQDATGHDWTDCASFTTEPTCEEKGVRYDVCNTCGAVQATLLEALGHKYQGGKCIRCDQKSPTEELSYSANSDGSYTVTGLGDFRGSDVVIPSRYNEGPVTGIGSNAFAYTNIGSIEIPTSVTSIGSYAFQYCAGLTEIAIPASVKSVANSAIAECRQLVKVTLPFAEGFDDWFGGKAYVPDSLREVVISGGTSLGVGTFREHDMIERVTLPEGLLTVDNQAFYVCESLVFVNIPSTVTRIDENAFARTAIRNIEIPASVEIIDRKGFELCENLQTVQIADDSRLFMIGTGAFYGCSMKEFKVPDSVTSIGMQAFYGCSGLKEIVIGTHVTSIRDSAFELCNALQNVYYKGAQNGWDGISIGNNNNYLLNATRYYFTEDEPTEEAWAAYGYYWHYDPATSLPTPWTKKEA